MSVRAILFDFDYTLADSSAGIIDCANYALQALGVEAVSPETVRRTIGLSLADTYRSLAGDAYKPEDVAEFVRHFMRRADEIMVERTTVYSFVPETIMRLRAGGYKLGIVSTKFRFRIEAVMEREGLTECFDVMVGGEDVSRPKPDPEGLLKAIEALAVPRSRCLYLGDSVVDAETSRRAGVQFIPVLSGVTPREAFQDCQAPCALNDLAELPVFLAVEGKRRSIG